MKPVINFMGIRHLAFAVTVILTLVSLGSLAVKGLNFGLDLNSPGLRLPFVGRLGFNDTSVSGTDEGQ